MNYFSHNNNIHQRIACNDPSLTEVSIRRYPLVSLPVNEITDIVKSLQHNTVVKSVDISIPSSQSSSNSRHQQRQQNYYNYDDTDITAIESNENIDVSNVPNSHNTSSLSMSKSYKYLYDMLRTNVFIDTLSLRDIKCDNAWLAIANGMKQNTTIRELSLCCSGDLYHEMELSIVAAQSIRDIFMYSSPSLQCVRIKSFTLSSYTNIHCINEICAGLENNVKSNIKELHFHSAENLDLVRIISAIAKSSMELQKFTLIDCDIDLHATTSCIDEFDEVQVEQDIRQSDSMLLHPLIGLLSDTSNSSLSRTLTELRINECNLNTTDFAIFCSSIKNNTSICVLDLSGCDLTDDFCDSLSTLIRNNQSIVHLHLQENLLSDVGINTIANGLSYNTTLHTLDLKGNQITNTGCQSLAESISTCSHIQTLSLSDNAITDDGAKHLGHALRVNTHLHTLDLDGCMIADEGIMNLCTGLAKNTSIKELNLSNNWCTKLGGKYISDMLSTNITLESLDMSSCHMSDDTIEEFVQSLSCMGNNRTLKTLYISFNSFTNRGLRAIANMLSGNCNQIQLISAQYNNFDSYGLKSIVDALATNYYLESFFFWNGNISASHDTKLIDALDHYLNLNRAGRRALYSCDNNTTTTTTATATVNTELWPFVLHYADNVYGANAIYNFLREKPALLLMNNGDYF